MKDTEEVRPGFFLQKRGEKYKRVYPLIWDGKYQVKEQLGTVFTLRTFFTIGLILFIAWAYQNDVQAYQDFYVEVRSDPVAFCAEVRKAVDVGCSIQDEESGLCNRNKFGNFSLEEFEVINEEST